MAGNSYQAHQDASIAIAAGVLSANQGVVTYGSIAVGKSLTKTIQIKNTGLRAVEYAGEQLNSESFLVVPGATAGEGGRCNGTIASQQVCNVIVSYKPNANGANDEAVLFVTYKQVGSEVVLAETVTLIGLGVGDNAVFPWQNPTNKLDADNDGRVTPLDVLTLINDINRNQTRMLPASRPVGGSDPFLDVNGDGALSPLDILEVINSLNAGK